MKRPIHYFHTYQDFLEMQVGDILDRVLPNGIDDKIGCEVTSCAIAIDAWDDRPATTTKRPRVMDGKFLQGSHVSIWPKCGVRYDFEFADDSATQITMRADKGKEVAGYPYRLRLKNIQNIKESTPASRQRERRTRAAKTRVYESLIQTWIEGGREGPQPEKPSHLRGSHHVASERIRALYEVELPHIDAHAEMLKRRKERQRKRDQEEKRRREPPSNHKH